MSRSLFLYTLFALCLTPLGGMAQQVTLSGIVTDGGDMRPMGGVAVSLRQTDGRRVVRYAVTKKDGSWQMPLTEFPKGHLLLFSMMGYGTDTIRVDDGRSRYDVTLYEKTVRLKEVTVKSPNIRQRGDTLSYNVASFADVSDKTLADVLKKMPGIEVSESGEIKHNGKTLNKFYIEGHDMLGGRYSLATNNIHQKDVATVEVMQNHQPVKALEDMSFSDNPAINIRLKETAKNRLVGTLKAGGGFNPDVWIAEGTLMRFSKKTQSLNTVKSNNTGGNIGKESNQLITDDDGGLLNREYTLKDYINLRPDRLTDIDEDRVRDNRSHSVALNNLWAISGNTDISTQFIYNHDRLVSASQSSTSYFLNDSTIINEEDQHAKTKQNLLTASVALNTNTNRLYLSNTLSANISWNDIDIVTTGTYPNKQTADVPSYKVNNRLELLRRSGNRAFTFNSYTTFISNPHKLSVERGMEKQRQSVESHAFYSNNSTSLGFYLHPLTVSMKAGLIVMSRSMESKAEGLPDSLGMAVNHVGMSFLRAYASPEAEYSRHGWNIRVSMPVSYTPYMYKDKLLNRSDSRHKVQFSPSVFAKYTLSSHFDISLSGNITQREINEQDFYDGLIMSDYRNMSLGYIDYAADHIKHLSLGLSCRQPLHTLFANASLSRSRSESHRITSRDFAGDYIINSYESGDTHTDSWMASARIAKGLGLIHGMISLSANYMDFEGMMLQSTTLSHYRSQMWNLSAKLNLRPAECLLLTYEAGYAHETMRLKDVALVSTSSSLSQHLDCHLNLTKRWLIKLTGSHYSNQVAEGSHKQLIMADASTSYSLKNSIEIALNATNIFNKSEYGYTVLSSLMRTSRTYQLRPRIIYATVFLHF